MIAIIPARGGSKRIANKNRRMFHGKPIISYSIETALASNLFEQIIVSTDDEHIATIAKSCGATAFWRDSRLSYDDIGTQEVAANVLQSMKITEGLACCIYATAPLMRVKDLVRAYTALRASPDAHFAYSVGLMPFRDAGQFYMGRVASFLSGHLLDGEDVLKIVVPDQFVCDINTAEDWVRAEGMYEALKVAV